ncbi:MAG TPA: PDZ domain-containing protein [Verrucomicrobiae bacterium]|nr:PDZ domain-containing protein [Verrucomicrobiae bacterium]
MEAVGQPAAAGARDRILRVMPGLNEPAAPVSARKLKIVSVCALVVFSASVCSAQPYFVSPAGDDANPGTLDKPFATLQRAQQAVRQERGTVYLRGGIYYLPETLVFTAQDSGTKDAPVIYQAYEKEQPVISGGARLAGLKWRPDTNGIMQAQAPKDLRTEEIFVNGERQILARYPNFDPQAQYFDGFTSGADIKRRAARWADPAGGYLHAMHPALWGDFTWRITGKDANGNLIKEGGWQNNRGGGINEGIQFVENIFEELDAPGEWFLNSKTHTLYFYLPVGLDLKNAVVEATRLRTLVEFRGGVVAQASRLFDENQKRTGGTPVPLIEAHPVKWITLRGLTFRQAARTVMDTREPLLRSDWAIYRGGAIFFNGAEDCALKDCFLDQPGGNAIFVSNYNRRLTIRACRIDQAGANGICFVGDPNAARSPLFNYNQTHKLDEIDRTPGPKTDNYPADCLVDDCLIHETGRVEKQTAGVEIDLAQNITVRHCSIYDVPRAGINIGDGCWGGDIIEFCDVFDTVKETGDHGSINSWGRDRYWRPNIGEVNAWVRQVPDLPKLDAVKPNVLANNRWRCDHGWDIDLDDGSSFYIITNNLCLHGGIKNREGFGRVVENNIMVDNSYNPHVWFAECGDVFLHNIVWTRYLPANMHRPPWGADMDYNLVQDYGATTNAPATRLQQQSGRDEHSIVADAQFIDPAHGDYRVKDGSPALALGFVNFPMDQFGVQKLELKAIARVPQLPQPKMPAAAAAARDAAPATWLGASVRNIRDEGEMSAFGLPGVTGVLVLGVPADSALARAGLRKNDVILSINSGKTADTAALLKQALESSGGSSLKIGISRDQKEMVVQLIP